MAHEFKTTVATMRAWALDGQKTSQFVLDWLATHTQLPGSTRVMITPTEVQLVDPAQAEAARIISRAAFEAGIESKAAQIQEPVEFHPSIEGYFGV